MSRFGTCLKRYVLSPFCAVFVFFFFDYRVISANETCCSYTLPEVRKILFGRFAGSSTAVLSDFDFVPINRATI